MSRRIIPMLTLISVAVTVVPGGLFNAVGAPRNREDVRTSAVAAPTSPGGNRAPVYVAPIGDSITQADSAHNSWRRPLWFMLESAGHTSVDFVGSHDANWGGPPPDPDFDMDHEGHWGWRVDQVLDSMPDWLEGYTPDIVLIHLGTNDLAHGDSVSGTVAELEALIGVLRADNAGVTVLLAQIIPESAGYVPEGLIEALNAEIPGIADRLSTAESPIIVVDHHTGYDPVADNYDGLHPNVVGEQKMADNWFGPLDAILSDEPSVPTVTDWGLLVMTLAGMVVGTVMFRTRRYAIRA